MGNKFGIELEFFVRDEEDNIIPAYEVTDNTDGNPVIGELRTNVHDDIVDCVFELKKLIYLEERKLAKKNCKMVFEHTIRVDSAFVKNLREDHNFINAKSIEALELRSIYGKGTGSVLTITMYKGSLQLNISNNETFYYEKYSKLGKKDATSESSKKIYGEIFDYVTLISRLDAIFATQIKETKRVKGVYAIKDGKFGKRIEYRSLPNTIELDELILAVKKALKKKGKK